MAPATRPSRLDENQFKVGDVDGDGKAEALIANALGGFGRIDVIDLDTGLPEEESGIPASGFGPEDVMGVSIVDPLQNADTDGDGIPDGVELDGIRNESGDIVDGWNLDDEGASPCRPDILIEADYMDASGDATNPHNHLPDQAAIDEVVAAFDAAPVTNPIDDCPYPEESAADGIGLHVVVDDALDHENDLNGKAGFEAVKAQAPNFDDALDPYVHYALFAHEMKNDSLDGLADFTDDLQDFAIFLGSGTGLVGSREAQASAFMHELGHALGLGHGGGDDANQKPNYVSTMNYSYAVEGAPDFGVILENGDRAHDYSRTELDPLTKTKLREPDGIGKDTGFQTLWYDDAGTEHVEVADGALDWDFDGDDSETVKVNVNRDQGGLCVEEDPTDGDKTLKTTADADDVVVTVDGFEDIHGGTDLVCDTTASGGDLQSVPVGTDQVLNGFDDWANLDLLHGTPGGSTSLRPPTEMTEAEQAQITAAWDQARFPDLSLALDAPRPGFHAASLGIATDAEHVYALHSYRTVTNPATTDRPGTLVVLDRQAMTVQSRITVGVGPRSVAVDPVRKLAYVVNSGVMGDVQNFNVMVVDLVIRKVVDQIEIGQGPIDVAVNVGLNRVYVSNPFAGRIEVIDGATRTKLAPIPIGPGPQGLAVDETRDLVYVAVTKRGGGQPEIARLASFLDNGVTRPRVLPSVHLGDPSIQPVDVAVDPGANRVYVAGLGTATAEPPSVTVVDGATRQIVTRIRNRGPVRAIAVHPEQGLVIAVGDRGVDLIDPGRLEVVRQIDVGLPFSVAPGTGSSRQFYVGDFITGELSRRSYSSGKIPG